jgi:transposase InsO family protein
MRKLEMTEKEIDRVKTLEKVMDGHWTQKKASETLKLSLRQTKRLCKKYKSKGAEGLIHLSRGKPSNRGMDNKTKARIVNLLSKEEFIGFGPTLLKEVFEEEYEIKVSREWLRHRMIAEGKWKAKRGKKVTAHPRRKRRSRIGELIQIDGSYEDWFEDRGPRCCLLVMIDDATSEIMSMRFVEHETTQNYFEIMKGYIKRYNRPLAIYSDRHSIFKTSRGEKVTSCTQFERAMKELEIEMIHARSPQAKGRVERANGTLQDRLIKKMRRRGLKSMEEGNSFLEEYRKEHNKKFARPAENVEDAHVEMLSSMNLNKILVIKEKRKVLKNLEIQYSNIIYQLDMKNSTRRMQGVEINVLDSGDGKLIFEYEGKEIKHKMFQEHEYKKTDLDHKELEVYSSSKKFLTSVQRHRRGMACNF